MAEFQKIKEVMYSYYSRKEVQQAIYEFCKNRETIPRYFEGFGKRPDMLEYPTDVYNLIKKGTSSFHCSEELWQDPLLISTDMTPEQYNEQRIGWDFLIDIDSKYLDYSKIAAKLLIQALEYHGVKNIGRKFSVSADTPVLIKQNNKINLFPIKKAIENFKKSKNMQILSLDKQSKLKFSRIYDSLEHDDELFEITHEHSKIPIKATAHHSVFVFNNGKIIQKKVSELSKDDFLVTYNTTNNPLSQNKLEITNAFTLNNKNQTTKIKITKELCRLIGYYLSEGHVTNTINQVGFTFNINEKEYIKDCTNLLKSITKRKISIRHPNTGSTQILIHSKEWATFFEEFCGKSKKKHLPEFAWKLNKELFSELLIGYIRGDGYKIGEYGIVIKSVAQQLTKELVWLCKLNNISCSLSTEQNKPHKLPQGNLFKGSFVYMIKIPKSELNNLEFFRNRNKFSPYPRDRTFPVKPLNKVYKQIKPKLFNHHRKEQMTLKKTRANAERIKKVIGWFETTKSIEMDQQSRKIIENYKQLLDSDVGAIKIKSIKSMGIKKVYDVSVEETESFFGNDYPILLHNSGSKGFHILIPWKAFPKEVNGIQTKDMFPEWPRAIANYLHDMINDKLTQEIHKQSNLEEHYEIIYKPTNQKASTHIKTHYKCPNCKSEVINTKSKKDNLRCNVCNYDMQKIKQEEYYIFEEDNSIKSPEKFEKKLTSDKLIDSVDIILVASRHLFRAPYSLHEKTGLASVVLENNEIETFNPNQAHPMKVKIKSYMPNCEEGEARELLLQSLDYVKKQPEKATKYTGKSIDLKGLTINESMFPECIKKILKGIKQDGRKRALFILLGFYNSLEFPQDYIEEKILKWDKKNYKQLKWGYIKSQIDWFARSKIMPPNCNSHFYKELNVNCKCQNTKNPVSYTIKQAFKFARNNPKQPTQERPQQENQNK